MTPADQTGALRAVARENGRFTVSVAGNVVGYSAFADRDGQRAFYHTQIDQEFAGRGLATALIAGAVAATRAENLRVVPLCPTMVAYVRKHADSPELSGNVDPPTRALLQWLRTAAPHAGLPG